MANGFAISVVKLLRGEGFEESLPPGPEHERPCVAQGEPWYQEGFNWSALLVAIQCLRLTMDDVSEGVVGVGP